jgi:hypothetical protein
MSEEAWSAFLRSFVFAGVALAAVVLSACSTTGAHIVEASARADGRTLNLTVGSCNADLTAVVEESPSQVTVTVTARDDTSDDCLDGLIVHLDHPLGDRQLLDGVTGAGGVRPAHPILEGCLEHGPARWGA